ncbi:MAG: (d)CMP kinase [Alphaproteobacteria bacterium]
MAKPIIAIDGPAASGKGTLARALAEKLGFAHMDTGALYRAAAFELITSGLSTRDEKDAVDAAQILVKKIKNAEKPADILDNLSLREDRIGQQASKIAAYPTVREILNGLQRSFIENPGNVFSGSVLDGRDIGTVIAPHAPLKLFITASAEIRAKRRLKELQSKGLTVTYEAVLKDMRERDARDAERKTAPMKPAGDAVTIDSSNLDAGQMLEKALFLARERLKL